MYLSPHNSKMYDTSRETSWSHERQLLDKLMITWCLKCIRFIQYLLLFQKIQVALPLPSDVSPKTNMAAAMTASHFGSDKETAFGLLAVAGSPLQICAKLIDMTYYYYFFLWCRGVSVCTNSRLKKMYLQMVFIRDCITVIYNYRYNCELRTTSRSSCKGIYTVCMSVFEHTANLIQTLLC